MGCITVIERERVVFLNPSSNELATLAKLGFSRNDWRSNASRGELYEIDTANSAPLLEAIREALGDVPIMNTRWDGWNKVYVEKLISESEISPFEPHYITEVE